VPVAVIACDAPGSTVAPFGVTAIDTSAGEVTSVLPETLLSVAEIIAVPVPTAVTTPLLLTVATAVLVELQLT
jgi:hypothetical protein